MWVCRVYVVWVCLVRYVPLTAKHLTGEKDLRAYELQRSTSWAMNYRVGLLPEVDKLSSDHLCSVEHRFSVMKSGTWS